MIKNGFLTEMHFHTGESSTCSPTSAKESIPLYYEYGYKTIVVTDHMARWYIENRNIDDFLLGYRTAKEVAKDYNINVLLGMEVNLDSKPNDYLIYGATEELFYNNPELPALTEDELRQFADENDLFIVQAHPYRPHCIPADPKNLDGYEVYNGNTFWFTPDQWKKADLFANEHHLIKTGGTDFHEPKHTLGTGLIFPEEIKDMKTLISHLKKGDYEFAKSVTFDNAK